MWDKSGNFQVDGCHIYQTSGENTLLGNLMCNANLMLVLRKLYLVKNLQLLLAVAIGDFSVRTPVSRAGQIN